MVQVIVIKQKGFIKKGRRKKQVILTCPYCQKEHKTDYRKKGGQLGKGNYKFPAHTCLESRKLAPVLSLQD